MAAFESAAATAASAASAASAATAVAAVAAVVAAAAAQQPDSHPTTQAAPPADMPPLLPSPPLANSFGWVQPQTSEEELQSEIVHLEARVGLLLRSGPLEPRVAHLETVVGVEIGQAEAAGASEATEAAEASEPLSLAARMQRLQRGFEQRDAMRIAL